MSKIIKKTVYISENALRDPNGRTMYTEACPLLGNSYEATLTIVIPDTEITLKLTREKLAKIWDGCAPMKYGSVRDSSVSKTFAALAEALGLPENE